MLLPPPPFLNTAMNGPDVGLPKASYLSARSSLVFSCLAAGLEISLCVLSLHHRCMQLLVGGMTFRFDSVKVQRLLHVSKKLTFKGHQKKEPPNSTVPDLRGVCTLRHPTYASLHLSASAIRPGGVFFTPQLYRWGDFRGPAFTLFCTCVGFGCCSATICLCSFSPCIAQKPKLPKLNFLML